MATPRTDLRGDALAGNLDTSFLKIVALLCMLTDHLGAAMFQGYAELRVIGRIALPLYAWCLVVGCVKTKDPLRYALRMLLLAAVSQPLYMMALNHTWTDLNILFLLTLGVIAITGIRRKFLLSQIWAPALCFLALGFVKIDYGWRGLMFILLLYFARGTKGGLVATFIAYALFWGSSASTISSLFGLEIPFASLPGIGNVLAAIFKMQSLMILALPLVVLNTSSNIRMPKWLGYALYPMHLVLLIVLRLTYGGVGFDVLVKGF